MSEDDNLTPSLEVLDLTRSDMRQIGEYGNEHPDEYGGHWFEDHRRAYGVAFTGSLGIHAAALRTLLRFPDCLRLRQCDYTYTYLRHLQEGVFWGEHERNPDGSIRGAVAVHGVGLDVKQNVVVVRLLPGQPEVEERLANQYGAVIRIERGGKAVPL